MGIVCFFSRFNIKKYSRQFVLFDQLTRKNIHKQKFAKHWKVNRIYPEKKRWLVENNGFVRLDFRYILILRIFFTCPSEIKFNCAIHREWCLINFFFSRSSTEFTLHNSFEEQKNHFNKLWRINDDAQALCSLLL